MSFSLGCDGIYTGGWDNAWGRTVYEEKQRHEQWQRETDACNRSMERKRQEKLNARKQTYSSYAAPSVIELPKLTPAQEAELEAECQARREAEAKKEELRDRIQQQRKEEWNAWRQLPLTSRMSRLVYWMSPGYIDQFLFERTQAAVEVAELNHVIELFPQPGKLFAVKQAQKTFAIVNRLTRRWMPPAVVTGFALLLTLAVGLVAGLCSGSMLAGLIVGCLSVYAVNVAKLMQYSFTLVGYCGLYRAGVVAREFGRWLRNFFYALFRVVLMAVYFAAAGGAILLTHSLFAG